MRSPLLARDVKAGRARLSTPARTPKHLRPLLLVSAHLSGADDSRADRTPGASSSGRGSNGRGWSTQPIAIAKRGAQLCCFASISSNAGITGGGGGPFGGGGGGGGGNWGGWPGSSGGSASANVLADLSLNEPSADMVEEVILLDVSGEAHAASGVTHVAGVLGPGS